MDITMEQTATLAAALGGFAVAWHVYRTKARGKVLVCPIGSDCDAVVNSSYSKIFGIRIEVIGMLYYGAFALAEGALIAFSIPETGMTALLLKTAASLAEVFALYLIFLQSAVLKEWCLWCIASFIASTTIFFLVFF